MKILLSVILTGGIIKLFSVILAAKKGLYEQKTALPVYVQLALCFVYYVYSVPLH